MAEEAREATLVAIAKQAINSDVDFMELVPEFSTIYNKKSKDFHDKRKKKNCRKKVASKVAQHNKARSWTKIQNDSHIIY